MLSYLRVRITSANVHSKTTTTNKNTNYCISKITETLVEVLIFGQKQGKVIILLQEVRSL